MQSNEYFESVSFQHGNNFNVSRALDIRYLKRIHWHPFVEILVSLTDGNVVEINFTQYDMGINDIVLICPGDLHTIQQGSEASFLIIQFSSDMLSILHELSSHSALIFRHRYLQYNPSDAESDRLVLLMKEFAAESDSHTAFRQVRMYSILLRFFENLGQRCIRLQEEDNIDMANLQPKATRQMAEACMYVAQNCKNPLTLEDISLHMGISKSHFSHLFKQYTNMTFVDFLTAERIKQAQAMFLNPNALVVDIAFDSGFSSISSFNRAFKKITGMSPSEFRKTMASVMT